MDKYDPAVQHRKETCSEIEKLVSKRKQIEKALDEINCDQSVKEKALEECDKHIGYLFHVLKDIDFGYVYNYRYPD